VKVFGELLIEEKISFMDVSFNVKDFAELY